jgi:hypothetical protein
MKRPGFSFCVKICSNRIIFASVICKAVLAAGTLFGGIPVVVTCLAVGVSSNTCKSLACLLYLPPLTA